MAGFGTFDEDKHPRDEDGKFSSGGGGGGGGASSDSSSSSGSSRSDDADPSEDKDFSERHKERLEGAYGSARTRYDSSTGQVVQRSAEEAHAVGTELRRKEATKIAGEERARKAGLVPPVPEVVARARAAHTEANKAIGAIATDLDSAHRSALTAVHELGALRSEEHGVGSELEFDDDSLARGLQATATEMGGEDTDYSDLAERALDADRSDLDGHGVDLDDSGDPVEWDDSDKPERHQYETDDGVDEEEFKSDLADYEQRRKAHEDGAKKYTAAREGRQKKFNAKAAEAQDALEALHEKQVAALGNLKTAATKYRKETAELEDYSLDDDDAVGALFNEKFKGEATFDRDEGTWSDPKIDALHSSANDAYQRDIDDARQELDDEGFRGGDDAQQALKDAIKETAAAIKELAKHTKRPAKLAKPPAKGKTKKSANRPGWVPRESVEGMAAPARFKLTLSKLDFLSLVDHPAQQTASIRLIKRAGAQDAVEAQMLARIVKVTEGSDPLLYCWAFTCTDENGQPYHDLQGDAVSPDFIKAAEEFIKSGGAVDEMHDGAQKSRIAFAYPMDSEIAAAMLGKAAGEATKISGLMVAIRPTAEQLAKVLAKEFNGVSIAGAGIREIMKARKPKPKGKGKRPFMPYKRRVSKLAVLTSATDGHVHTVDLEDPAHGWSDALSTSYQTSEGAEQGHSHPWTYDATTGAVTIGEDSGHGHTVSEVVPAEIIAEAAAEDSECCSSCGAEYDEGDRYCSGCGAGLHGGPAAPCVPPAAPPVAPSVVIVSARAPDPNSPPSRATHTVKSEEQAMATEQENRIAELEKQLAVAKQHGSLTDAQRTHLLTLRGSEADAFLAKSKTERDVVLADIEKANEVVYKSEVTGEVFRKNDDRRLIEMAKSNDEIRTQLKAAEVAKRDAEFAKRGSEVLTHVAKGVKGDIPARIMKAVNAEFADPKEYEEAVAALKSLNFAAAQLSKSTGVNPQIDPNQPESAQQQLDRLATDYAKANNVSFTKAQSAVLDTAEGARLYSQIPVGRA